MEHATLPPIKIWLMAPEIALFLWALLVFTFDVTTHRRSPRVLGYLALAGPLVAVIVPVVLRMLGKYGTGVAFGPMFVNDAGAMFFKAVFLGAAALAIAMSFDEMKERIVHHRGEYYGLILLSTVGMMFLSSSNELLSLYVALELTTVPLFVLAAFYKEERLSVEAGIKYLVVGAFSSALLLYGISFLYGMSSSTVLWQVSHNLARLHVDMREIGLVLILANLLVLAGLGFKLALPPFHQWAPDVYQGAPTPVTAFLSVGSKAAGLVAFAKVMVVGLFQFYDPVMRPNDWGILAGLMAAAAMIIGNVMAVRQANVKRLLAYSSIAHAGYLMIGVLAFNELGLASVAFYLFVYMFANMGAFAVVAAVEHRTGSVDIDAFSALSRTSPLYAVAMTVFLLSLTGIPPLAGFFAKYYVFAAGIKQAGVGSLYTWLYWLVGIGLVTSVFALYYYARVIRAMYFLPETVPNRLTPAGAVTAVVVIGLAGVIVFGLYPPPVADFAARIPAVFGFTP